MEIDWAKLASGGRPKGETVKSKQRGGVPEQDNDDDASNDTLDVDDTPRCLSTNEIDEIVSMIRLKWNGQHTDVEQSIVDKHRSNLRQALTPVKIRPSQITNLKNTIVERFYRAVITPGEAVGVNAAQSIGEPITQQTLNSFHSESPTQPIHTRSSH